MRKNRRNSQIEREEAYLLLAFKLNHLLYKFYRTFYKKKLVSFTNENLDAWWDDDTVDIKNFSHLDKGTPEHKEMKKMLTKRMFWYTRQGLFDWAEQIDVALWSDRTCPV